jgi:O-succinylbenzoic acid--CoA ligase
VLIHFKRLSLTLQKDDFRSILKRASLLASLTSEELWILEMAAKLQEGVADFSFQTSGSTGVPKIINLSKDQLIQSAETTLSHFSIKPGARFLLCIHPQFIGGAMQVVRAYVNQGQLDVLAPERILDIDHTKYDLVSMVPLQLNKLYKDLKSHLNDFNHLLIGGATMDPKLEQKIASDTSIITKIYATYGMTETASHIAVRRLGSHFFKRIGQLKISINDSSCLKIRGLITKNQWLQTQDIVELIDENTFKWLGRQDFVINSGGFKVHPEKIEHQLKKQTDQPLMITSLPDEVLGQKVVLLLEGALMPTFDYTTLHPYEKPKKRLNLKKFIYTKNGKIDRKATRKLIEK